MRSHDLNRLLDKPGCEAATLLEISFSTPPHVNDAGITQAASADESDRHCNGPAPKRVFFRLKYSAFHSAWPERVRSTHKGTGARMAWGAYVLRLTCSLGIGGSAMDGNILRRTITMGAPQQVHSS